MGEKKEEKETAMDDLQTPLLKYYKYHHDNLQRCTKNTQEK